MPDSSTTNPVSGTVEESAQAAAVPQVDAISLDEQVDALITRVEKAAADVERRASAEDADIQAARFLTPDPQPAPQAAPVPEPEPEPTTEPALEIAAEVPESATFADVEEAIAEAEAIAVEELGELTDDAVVAAETEAAPAAGTPAAEEAELGESVDAAIAATETAGDMEALEEAFAQLEQDGAESAAVTSREEAAREPVAADLVEAAGALEAEPLVEAADFDSVDAILKETTEVEGAYEPQPADQADAEEEAVAVAAEAVDSAEALDDEDDHHFESFEEATSDPAAETTPPVDEVEVVIDESTDAFEAVASFEEPAAEVGATCEASEEAVASTAATCVPAPAADPALQVSAESTEVEPQPTVPAWRRVLQTTAASVATVVAKTGPLARAIGERTPQYWALVRPRLHAGLHLLNAPYRRLSPQMREFVGWAAVVTAFAACSVWMIIALRG